MAKDPNVFQGHREGAGGAAAGGAGKETAGHQTGPSAKSVVCVNRL